MRPMDGQLLKLKTKNLLKTFRSSDLHQFTVQHWNRREEGGGRREEGGGRRSRSRPPSVEIDHGNCALSLSARSASD